MTAIRAIPVVLTKGPFTSAEAKAANISEKVLRGKRFVRLYPRVWVLASYKMTDLDWIRAAELALPDGAQASHLTRMCKLGLNEGPLKPMHFTIEGELHLSFTDIRLHRTKVLPPVDAHGLTPAAAFIAQAAHARVIDLIKVGDWLLHNELTTVAELLETAHYQRWRPGASATIWITQFLDGRSRSLKESETRALLIFAGLPNPELNVDLFVDKEWVACVDLLYRRWRLVIEYEGRQHAETIEQWNTDIDRYARLRGIKHEYVQVTQEMLRRPRTLVARVHTKLVERGYDGPAPVFGSRWLSLFETYSMKTAAGGEHASTAAGER